jgi:hypothetical protein
MILIIIIYCNTAHEETCTCVVYTGVSVHDVYKYSILQTSLCTYTRLPKSRGLFRGQGPSIEKGFPWWCVKYSYVPRTWCIMFAKYAPTRTRGLSKTILVKTTYSYIIGIRKNNLFFTLSCQCTRTCIVFGVRGNACVYLLVVLYTLVGRERVCAENPLFYRLFGVFICTQFYGVRTRVCVWRSMFTNNENI